MRAIILSNLEASLLTFQQTKASSSKADSTKSIPESLPIGITVLADGVDPVVEYVMSSYRRVSTHDGIVALWPSTDSMDTVKRLGR